MAEERKFTAIGDLLKQCERISSEAAGHDAFFPVAVRVPSTDGKTTIRGQAKSTSQSEIAERGRRLLFIPTKEKVTLVRTRVGNSYQGDWIHEVVTKDGKKFLAMQKQLKELTK